MKTNEPKRSKLRRIFSPRRNNAANPWLILNLALFNCAGGWSQLVARQQAQQFGR
jgi:hypothetical protein